MALPTPPARQSMHACRNHSNCQRKYTPAQSHPQIPSCISISSPFKVSLAFNQIATDHNIPAAAQSIPVTVPFLPVTVTWPCSYNQSHRDEPTSTGSSHCTAWKVRKVVIPLPDAHRGKLAHYKTHSSSASEQSNGIPISSKNRHENAA